MGMSSSQARMLTLTARLHQVEFGVARLQDYKLQMARESSRVYSDYLNALDATKNVAYVLQSDGTMGEIPLTAAAIYTYGTLDDQYSLTTADGKTLIPESLHEIYSSTSTLCEYLDALGLMTTYTGSTYKTVSNPEYESAYAQWESDHAAWEDEYDAYQAAYEAYLEKYAAWEEEYAQYLIDYAAWEEEYAAWEASNPELVKDDTTQIWWETSDYSLADSFAEAIRSGSSSGGCYYQAMNGNVSCFLHVLGHIIDYDGSKSTDTYTTTLGDTFTLSSISGAYCDDKTLSDGETNSNDVFEEVSDLLNQGIYPSVEDDEECDVTEDSTDYEKLVSKWDYSTGTLKTMKQWAIDLYYVGKYKSAVDGYISNATLALKLDEFTTSLTGALVTYNEEVYEECYQTWLDEEPPKPSAPEMPIFTLTLSAEPELDDYINGLSETLSYTESWTESTVTDKALAQWYINLWYKMEGEDETQTLQKLVEYDYSTDSYVSLYQLTDATKSSTTYSTNEDWGTTENENYMVIPDEYLDDENWLYNAIQGGYVIIQAYSSYKESFYDTSISVDTGLEEVADEEELKKAEADYEAAMKRIDKKDSRYDTEIAMFETEREALIEEIDSLKTVAGDNVDMNFKLFS